MYSGDPAGDAAPGPFAPMPPVTSQPGGARREAEAEGRMAPPFMGQPTVAVPAAAAMSTAASETPWEDSADEGVVEPAFEADVSETSASLAALAHVAPKTDGDFPLDAFIIPEHSRRLPTGLDAAPAASSENPMKELADRLEKLSHRMRVDDTNALIAKLAGGDKLDAMLAVMLAGFVAGQK